MQRRTNVETSDVWPRRTLWPMAALATLGAVALTSWRLAQLRHHTRLTHIVEAVNIPHITTSSANTEGKDASGTSSEGQHAPVVSSVIVAATAPLTESDPCENSSSGSGSEDSSTQRIRRLAHIAQPVHEYEKRGLPGGAHGWRRVYGLLQASIRSISDDTDSNSSSNSTGSTHRDMAKAGKLDKDTSESHASVSDSRFSVWPVQGYRKILPDVSSLQHPVTELDVQDISYMAKEEHVTEEGQQYNNWHRRVYGALVRHFSGLVALSQRVLTRQKANAVQTNETSAGHSARHRGSTVQSRPVRRVTSVVRSVNDPKRLDMRRKGKSLTVAAEASQQLQEDEEVDVQQKQQERTLQDQISYLVHATHLARQEMETELVTMREPVEAIRPVASNAENGTHSVTSALNTQVDTTSAPVLQDKSAAVDITSGPCTALPMPPCAVARMLLTVPPSPVLTAAECTPLRQAGEAISSSVTTSNTATVNAILPAASNVNTSTTPDTSHKLTISQLWHLLETRRQLQMAHTRALQAGIGEGRDPAQLVQRYRAHRGEHNGYGQVLSDLTTEMRLRRLSTRSRAKAALTDNQASMRHVAMQHDSADDRTHIENEKEMKTRVSCRPHNQRRDAPHDSKKVQEDEEDNGEYGDVDEDERGEAEDTGVDRAQVVAMLSPRWSLVEGRNEESKYKRSTSNSRQNTKGIRGRARHNTNASLQSRTSSTNSNSNAAPLVPSFTSTNTMMMMQSAPLPMTTRSRHDSMHSARHSSLTTTTSSSSSTAPSSSCTSGSIATSHASSCCTSASQQQQQQQQQRMQERRRDDLTVKNTDGGAYYSLSVTYHDSLTGASRTVDAKSLPPLSVEGQSATSPLPIRSVSSRRVSGEVVQAAVAAPSQVREGGHSHISPTAALVTSHTTHSHRQEMQDNDGDDTEEGAVTVKGANDTKTVSSMAMHASSSEHNTSNHYIEVPATTASTHNPHELRQMSLLTATQTSSSVLAQHNNTTTTANMNSASVVTVVPKVAVFAAPLPAYEPMDGPQLQGVAGRRGEMRIGAFLGGGACGKVYECLNTETGQILAAKQIVFDAKDTKLRQRLKQLELEMEVLTLATRHHAPWIVGFHGAEKRGHSVLMYLEYCAHSSLLDFMAEGNGSEAARWGMASSSVPLAPHPSMQSYSIGTGGASLCHMLCNGLEYPSKERTTPPILPIVYDKAESSGSGQEGVVAKSLNERIEDEEGAAVCDMSAGAGAGKRHRHYHNTQSKQQQPHVTSAANDTSSNAAASIAEYYRANEEAAALQPVTALSLQSHVECVELQFSPGSSTAHPSLSRASSMSFTAQCSFTSSSTLTTTTTTSYTQTHNTSSNEETSNSGSEGSASVHSVALTMTLSEAMHPQVPPLSIAQVQRFTRQTVEGLHFLHTSGYAHLDVKTANILITADEECRLADLGCAMRLKPADLTNTTNSKRSDGDSSYRLLQEHESITELRGTALYMAPEMIRFERTRIGSAADIWSLGCVVMEIATGCAPWRHVAKDKLHVLFRVGSARHELPLPPLLQAWMAEAKEWLAQWGEEAYPDGEKKEESSGRSDAVADTRRMTNEKEEGKRSSCSSTSDSTKEGEAAGKRGANVEGTIQPPRQRTRLEGERWGPGAQRVSTTTSDAANPVEEDVDEAAAQTAPPVCENDAAYMAQQRRLMHMYIELVDFVNCCLRIRPEARSTTTQLLQHPFLNL